MFCFVKTIPISDCLKFEPVRHHFEDRINNKLQMEFLLGIGVGFVNYYMPEPYMDEEFHAR